VCGIAGFVGEGTVEDLKRMNEALIHRGPDDEGIWFEQKFRVFLAHRRLSIVDLADGHQPMWTQDQVLGIIFNGEIYNHLELRKELKQLGYMFQTDHSDTEVLLQGYRAWGFDFVNRLNGMWAFCLYDRQKKILFCSRDRFGKKPFFYTQQQKLFAFASELTALTSHTSISPSISKQALKKYFAYGYIPAPNSLYERIYKLPAGYSLIFDIQSFSLKVFKYWDFVLEPIDTQSKNPEEEWGEELRELLEEAVKRRLMSDVPLGCFLSGGIDSSAIAYYAAKISKVPVKTFSIGFEEASFDESVYSNQMAGFLKTDHTLQKLSLETARTLLPQIVQKLDEPMGDSSLLPTFLLCQETRKQVTIALGGDGSDELFAGYDPFKALKIAEIYQRMIPDRLHQGIKMLVSRLPVSHRNMSLDFKMKRMLTGLSYPKPFWNSIWLGTLSPEDLEQLFEEPVDLEELYSEAIEQWDACKQTNLVDKTLQFYTKLYLQDDILVKIDRASMMHSLEVRCPFLDIDLVNFVRRLPFEYKFRQGETKYILKKALEPILPKDTLYRAKKGFGIPIGKWFQEEKMKVNKQEEYSFLNKSFIHQLWSQHCQGQWDHRSFLWNYWLLSQYKKHPL